MTPAAAGATYSPLVLGGLFLAGAVASAVNAVAGGGSLLSFPALLAAGVPALVANATNSAALWTGGLTSALGFWERLTRMRRPLLILLLPSLLGALLGAWLLVNTSARRFNQVVPALLLLATALLWLQPRLKRWVGGGRRLPTWLGVVLHFGVCVYGGYFGAGMGILMLALFGLYLEGDLHELNAMKAWLGLLVNLAAALAFLRHGLLLLGPGLALAAGAMVGGYVAARGAQRVDPARLRIAVAIFGALLTAWFTWQAIAAALPTEPSD